MKMKIIIKKTFFTLLVAGCCACLQAQKVGHLSFDSLVTLMPETKIAKEAAAKYLEDLKKIASGMEAELQSKYETYLKEKPGMSELVVKTKEEELQSLQTRIQDFNQQAQQDYQKKYGELTAPIVEKAKKAIEMAAKEQGLKYVLDTSLGGVLYSEPSEDITIAVKKKLDVHKMAEANKAFSHFRF